jgi:TolB protein
LQRVTDHGSAFFPSWSPDGNRLAYDATTLPKKGIWLVDSDGSTHKHLGLGRYPDWSADGEHLVYEGPPGTSESGPQLWTADTSATDSTQLTNNEFVNNRYPAWSPNGDWIAWSPINNDGNYELWIMRANGTEQQKLADQGREPAWGPSSERIVFAKPARESDLTALWTIRRDGSNLRQLTDPSRNPLN